MPKFELPPLPEDVVDVLNAALGGFNNALGLRFTEASYQRVVATLTINSAHHQPYGLVHGGVYTSMIETVASCGAAINAMATGRHAVGLDNSSSFLRAVREGTLTATATPLVRGRRTHVWTVTIVDDKDRTVAVGRVRMLVVEQKEAIAGEKVRVKAES